MKVKQMILSTQLSWDQQSDKNLSNSTDARAHSNELRIKVVIIMMVEMAMSDDDQGLQGCDPMSSTYFSYSSTRWKLSLYPPAKS